MCAISRVTVLLPLVPEIETTGTRRSASRIHDGGVVRASRDPLAPALEQPGLRAGEVRVPRRRDVLVRQREGGLGR